MNKIRDIVFTIMGLISLAFMILGVSTSFIILAILYNWYWLLGVIVWEGLGYYRHRYFKKQGKKIEGLVYK